HPRSAPSRNSSCDAARDPAPPSHAATAASTDPNASPAWSSPPISADPPQRRVEPRDLVARRLQPLAILLHDLGRRAADEIGVVQLLPDLSRFLLGLDPLTAKPCALRVEIDHSSERQHNRRLVQHRLR